MVRKNSRRTGSGCPIVLSYHMIRVFSTQKTGMPCWFSCCMPLLLSDFYASFMTVDNHVKRLQTRTTFKTCRNKSHFLLERLMGVEPTYAAWEAAVLPMNYTRRILYYCNRRYMVCQDKVNMSTFYKNRLTMTKGRDILHPARTGGFQWIEKSTKERGC